MATVESRPLPRSLRAFSQRDFTWFFTGGLVSSIGTNMQTAALAWVVQLTTGSALRTTAIAFVGFVPMLVLGPIAGVLADRVDRRRYLMATNTVLAVQAFALWALWGAGYGDQYWLLFALSLCGGVFAALQTPSWQALVSELVPRDLLANAITLNTTQFNIARALGPLFAGVMIQTVGAGGAFLANAASYLVVVGALAAIRTPDRPARLTRGEGTFTQWLAGLRYLVARPGLVTAMSVHTLFAVVVPPVVFLVPELSQDVLHVGAGAYGLLLGTFGIGAVAGAVILGHTDQRVRPSIALTIGLLLGLAAFLMLGHAHGLALGMIAMVAYGACYLVVVSVDHGTIQALVDDEHRGRVVSIWLMNFGLWMPLGLIIQGWLADRLGVDTVLTIDAVLLAVCIVAVHVTRGAHHLDEANYSKSLP